MRRGSARRKRVSRIAPRRRFRVDRHRADPRAWCRLLQRVHPRDQGRVNLDALRRCFPALSRIHNGLPVAYFDGPGGTQVPRSVADAMTEYLFHHNANTHWAYPTSEETDSIIAAAREAAARFLGAAPDEISFGANMTTITFHLARALGRTWKAGDEVIVTELDHHANVAPWRALEIDRGIVVCTARMSRETCQIDMEQLAQ